MLCAYPFVASKMVLERLEVILEVLTYEIGGDND
jgi:hypothetical protein